MFRFLVLIVAQPLGHVLRLKHKLGSGAADSRCPNGDWSDVVWYMTDQRLNCRWLGREQRYGCFGLASLDLEERTPAT